MIPTDGAAGGSVLAFVVIFGSVGVLWLVGALVLALLALVDGGDR